jgi:ABC-type antimicrobial peptide transport system permease subunit
MVVRETTGLVVTGAVLGVAAALAGARYVRGQLFEVAPTDPAAVGAAVLLLGVVAIAAAFLPAQRAVAIDPVAALRME